LHLRLFSVRGSVRMRVRFRDGVKFGTENSVILTTSDLYLYVILEYHSNAEVILTILHSEHLALISSYKVRNESDTKLESSRTPSETNTVIIHRLTCL